MARKSKNDEGGTAMMEKPEKKPAKGEQLDLIEVDTAHAKEFRRLATRYKNAQKQRMQFGFEEVKYKDQLRALAKECNIQADADGKMKFRADGCVITITPQEAKVGVKWDEEADEE